MAVCQAAVDDMQGAGINLSVQKLRAEISKWAETSSWGEQLKAALGLWQKRNGQDELVLSKDWHDDFLSAMEICEGNAERAAQMAGVGYGVVLNVMDARGKHFDPEFVWRFRAAEMARVAKLRELQMQTAEGDGKMAAGVRQQILEATLPNLHVVPKQQEVKVTGEIEHRHDHQHAHLHMMAPEAAREIVLASQSRVRRINAGRSDPEPSPAPRALAADSRPSVTIDLAPEREKVGVFVVDGGSD